MTHFLDHHETGRSPLVLTGLAASALIAATADLSSLPPVIWATWTIVTVALIYIFVVNPLSGSRLTAESWSCYTSEGHCTVPLSQIDYVHLKAWPDGRTSCRIYLTDERVISVPSSCVPPRERLHQTLNHANITVITG